MPAQITPAALHAVPVIWLPTRIGLAACLLLTCMSTRAMPEADSFEISRHIQHILEQTDPHHTSLAEDLTGLTEFYRQRNFHPAWLDATRLSELSQLEALVQQHGLHADDYSLESLRRLTATVSGSNPRQLALLELQASVSLAKFASHLHYGKLSAHGPRVGSARIASAAEISQLLGSGTNSEMLFAWLDSLAPDSLLYRKMQLNLSELLAMQKSGLRWPVVPNGPSLRPGMQDERVPLLRQRLGLPQHQKRDPTLYDDELGSAVIRFQQQHLLASDGVAGRQTLLALNTSLQQRIEQLRLNLDARRWARLAGESEYLLVNVPHFALHFMADDSRRWSTRVQVGRPDRPTPAMKTSLTAIMANPEWTVPPTIFRQDILPELRRNPGYLQERQFRVIDRQGHTVDSDAIDWNQVATASFPFRLRASAGRNNALGKLKFLMPNDHMIYLHDTPARNLFASAQRAVSSGCIRIEHPEKLAQMLAESQLPTTGERLENALRGTGTRYIGMDKPVPIIVLYATIDLDANNELAFAPDIYRSDPRLFALLDAPVVEDYPPVRLASLQ